MNGKGYRKEKLPYLRKVVSASASVSHQKNTIHSVTEVNVSHARELIASYRAKSNYRISFTGYIAACFARVMRKYPEMNGFISRNRLILFDSINISVMVERHIGGKSVPEPLVIRNCDKKSLIEITDEIRVAQASADSGGLGELTGSGLIRLIPGSLMKAFIRIADKSISMGLRFGKLSVTAVGMQSRKPFWFVPHGSGTILLTVGSIINRLVKNGDDIIDNEFLCLTASFDHDLIDGSPAARFTGDLIEEMESAALIEEILGSDY